MSKLIFIFDKKFNYIENTMGLVKAIVRHQTPPAGGHAFDWWKGFCELT
jgi:hypothetical protein